MGVFSRKDGPAPQTPETDRDEALFSSLQKKKKDRKRRTVRTVIIIVAVIALVLTVGVLRLRRRVQMSVASNSDVSSAVAERGSISTTVTGSGTLADVDEEEITVPAGVVIDEVLVKANEKVREGDELATLDKASLLAAMETMQSEIQSLDSQINSARSDEVSSTVTSGVEGTVTQLYAISGDLVTDVMAEHGCLAEIQLKNGQTIRVMGLAGTIAKVNTDVGNRVFSGSVLFTLTDTWFSANYDSYVQQRQEKEEYLLQLMQLYRNGGVLLAPYSGSVSSVDYDEENDYSGVEKYTVVTMSPDRQMEVAISVDETNILSLALGQTAEITVSSIGSDKYSGTVTEIGKTATSSSGVTRYSATITLDKAEGMLPGMTARAVVNIHGVDDALIIPVDALHQTSASSFVYTSYDRETGEYGGLKEVQAGISNSESVEILSGLEEGETVWYVEKKDNPFASFGYPGGEAPSGGGPSGGGMPSGGYPGGGPAGGPPSGMGGGARP